ncbi:MAG: CRISPR-associated protein Csx14, partial [Thermoproteota archaeon]
MSKNILLATLGTSPAVVTEAVDLLQEEGVRITGIFLFITRDRDVQESFALLVEHLSQHDGITWVNPIEVGVYHDVDNTDAAVEFLSLASQHLKTLRDAGHRAYVSIAGGRKAMAALLALAVQFYGAERLFHIWVPPWLEVEGNIETLRKYRDWPEKLNEYLHPSLDADPEDRPQMVTLPVIGLFPFLDDIRAALKGEGNVPRDIRRLLQANG